MQRVEECEEADSSTTEQKFSKRVCVNFDWLSHRVSTDELTHPCRASCCIDHAVSYHGWPLTVERGRFCVVSFSGSHIIEREGQRVYFTFSILERCLDQAIQHWSNLLICIDTLLFFNIPSRYYSIIYRVSRLISLVVTTKRCPAISLQFSVVISAAAF